MPTEAIGICEPIRTEHRSARPQRTGPKGLLQYRIGRSCGKRNLSRPPVPGNAREKRAGRLAGPGSMWRLADSQHGSDQVVQWPGQVLLGDQDNLVIDAKMADRPSRNRTVRRQGGQGPCEERLPRASVTGRGGVNHPAPHGAVWTDQGHDDPHQLSLSPPAASRQADHDDSGL